MRGRDDALQAEGVGGEGRDDDALIAARELPVEAVGDDALGRRKARTLDVGRVAQKGQHALAAQLAEAGQVDHAVLCGRVDLEVAGHNDRSDRRADGKRHRVGNGVVDVDEFHGEAARLDRLSGLVGEELDGLFQMVLLQLELDDARRQARGMDGAVELLHGVGNAADMVLVAVRQEQAADLLLVLHKIGHVRNDQIDAVHVVLGEAEAAVHDDDVLAVFQNGDILADLIETAKRDDF